MGDEEREKLMGMKMMERVRVAVIRFNMLKSDRDTSWGRGRDEK